MTVDEMIKKLITIKKRSPLGGNTVVTVSLNGSGVPYCQPRTVLLETDWSTSALAVVEVPRQNHEVGSRRIAKRWRVSDVFLAIARRSPRSERPAKLVAKWAKTDAAAGALTDDGVGTWLRAHPQAGHALGITGSVWMTMTDTQCVWAVVSAAKRLRVPKHRL